MDINARPVFIVNIDNGLEFRTKYKSLHLVLCILLAGDIATNPGLTRSNAQLGNLSESHPQVPVAESPKKEFGTSLPTGADLVVVRLVTRLT
jgi:hypothetical protein